MPGTERVAQHSGQGEALRRHPGDLLRLTLGTVMLAGSTLLVSKGEVGLLETDVFRLFNHLPSAVGLPLRIAMEAGSYGAVVASTGLALIGRRKRLARDLAASGSAAWVLARLLKLLVLRGRPGAMIADVVVRGADPTGLGFPSGHAAVAAALATAAGPYLDKRTSRVTWGLAWLVAAARLYVGAHFPLDAIAGAALGWSTGAALHLLQGAPGGAPSDEAVRKALEQAGVDATEVGPFRADARGSTPFWARTSSGPELFVKILSRDQRDADWLFKGWRFLAYRELEDEAPFATPKQQIEHEAYVLLLAQRAKVRVPPLVAAVEVEPGTALLAEEKVDSRGLNALAVEEIDDDLLRKLWGQVKLLHAAGIAHRDLRRNNVVVDPQGEPWIIDFGYAEAAASPRRRAQDVAELLASLSVVVGVERVVRTAVEVLGKEAVLKAMPLLQPLALSSVTRAQARAQQGRLEEIRQEVARLTGAEAMPPEPMGRFQVRTVLMLLGAAFAIHLLLPQVGELEQTIAAFRSVDWRWLVPAALGAALTYAAAALSLTAAAPHPLAFGRTVLVQLAGSFVNRVTPKGIGGAGLIERYLEHAGIDRAEAITSVATTMSATSLVHIPSLIVVSALLGRTGVDPVHLPKNWHLLAATALGLAAAGGFALLLWPAGRRKLAPVATAAQGLLGLLKSPWRALRLLGGAAGLIVVNLVTLAVCLYAFGSSVSMLKVATVYLGGTAIASASPTPGGLGAIEAALVAGLTAVGVPSGPAVAGVLTFRLFTFWLPILPGWASYRYLQQRHLV